MKPPKPPAHLSRESKALWKQFVFEYEIFDRGGLEILRTGLEARDRAQAAREAIDREGMTVSGRDGQTKPHPLLTVERDSRAAYQSALKALNLTTEPPKPLGRPGR